MAVFSTLKNTTRGFSLVELLVVTAVIVIVTTTVLSNQAKFGTTVVLERLAYDIALSLRKAQTYGVSVYRSASGVYSSSYGIYIDLASPSSYVLFADGSPGNGMFNTGETLENQNLPNGYRLEDICVTPSFGAESCTATRIDIAFSRPDPDALIRINGLSTLYSSGRIVVRSPQGDLRSVIIESSGQIVVH